MQRIAVVGAGFSGAATVIHLLRRHGGEPLMVTLVSRHPELGRGVAYGTHSPTHLLNVPAARMSLFPDDEEDFLRFAKSRDPQAAGGSFMPRSLYGEYLAARLEQAVASASRARFAPLTGEAVGIVVRPDGRARLGLADGSMLEAERVVIASGNYPPGDPRIPDMGFYRSAHYIRDPWAPGALERADPRQPVLLIGTGLTMMDVALELDRRGFAQPLHALSRRGLLPQVHRASHGAPLEPSVVMDMLLKGEPNARRWSRALRLCAAELASRGVDWRDVIGALRPHTAELWQRLDLAEKRRFLRHLQPYWDSHRHRTAPIAHAKLERLFKEGQLTVRAGYLRGLSEEGGKVRVLWRKRHAAAGETFEVGTVINCTGPKGSIERSADPLVRSLLEQGLMQSDALGLGLQADKDGALLDRMGRASTTLFYTGPLLKARDWECTAVPELRVSALKLADKLAAGFKA
jgi:uncharacterized NAD(P)/FAD-binding protein YdhS